MVEMCELVENTVTRAICTPEEEIVISGMSGRFPKSLNAKEFEDNLYNKVDMCDDSEIRWRHENPKVPKRSGKAYNLDKFDSTFFRINEKQANALDPQMRIVMEHAYEAIIDAGANPYSLRGSKTGVFVGAHFTESEYSYILDSNSTGHTLTGLGRAMFPNRLSYALDLRGPSVFIDSSSSSSLYALNAAFNAIRSGECEAAIVGATNVTLHPNISHCYSLLGVLAKDGISRPFDEKASGYVRAEAFGCLFLQKSKDAKRIYSTVLYSKTNCTGSKSTFASYPPVAIQSAFYEEFYREIGINPNCVAFVEANGSSNPVGDTEECNAIDQVFCKDRKKPLPIGSTKSNMGHAESAAGVCSIIKCIFAMENKLIPPNINFTNYRRGIEGFEMERLQVVTEPQPFNGSLIAINSFHFGGANGHCLLRAHTKEKVNGGRPLDKLPRLVNWAGRTEEACNAIFDDIITRPLDAEYIGLLHSSQQYSTSGNVYRSFGVFSNEENENAKCLSRDVQHFPAMKPKTVFVFSGMGSQWCEMGTKLLEIPLFRKSVEKCHDILVPKGLNLMEILTSSDKSTFDNVVHSFVGIAAIQIGICDILEEIDVKPDLIVGHSVGELGCAYADKCLTAKEMILCAYSRGLATVETETIKGAMAAVGLGYQQIKSLLPETIDVACHNSSNSSTISGPKEDVEKFVAELKAKDIFAKEVPAANRAFHSRYISEMGPKLMTYLKQIITDPKERSKKWLSSSVPKDKWELPESQLCSAEYQTNNLLSPVLFEETLAQLPMNIVTIEIAPHGLLQAILKKALPNSVNIPLTQRDNPENHIFFLSALGKVFQAGADMSLDKLYPKIEFPVSRGTPRISHVIQWNHKEDFHFMNYNINRLKTGEKYIQMSLESPNYAYFLGHVIDGKPMVPQIGFLQLVWDTFAALHDKLYNEISVEFEDVKFLKTATLQANTKPIFTILVNIGTGHFEVVENTTILITGFIREIENEEEIDVTMVPTDHDTIVLPTKDFYKELRLRGYQYSEKFRNILEARSDGLIGKVKWTNNWITFIESIFQLSFLQHETRSLILPSAIEKLTINLQQHFKFQLKQTLDDQSEINYFEVRASKDLDLFQCGGVEIKTLEMTPITRDSTSDDPIVEVHKFIPTLPAPKVSLTNASRICAQHVLENTNTTNIRCVEIVGPNHNEDESLSSVMTDAFKNNPEVEIDITVLASKEIETLDEHKNCMVAILSDAKLLETVTEQNFNFLLIRKTNYNKSRFVAPQNYNIVCVVPIDCAGDQTLILLHRILMEKVGKSPAIIKITSHDKQFGWLEPLKNALKAGPTILYAQDEKTSGIIGLFNCIRREAPTQSVRYFFIDDVNAPPFNIDSPFYLKQLNLNMAANVYRNGQWGNYRHLLMDSLSKDEPASEHVFANLVKPGDLSSFKWFEGPLKLKTTENLIKIQYSALNRRDVMLANGNLSFEPITSDRVSKMCPLGVEFAGITDAGEQVMGITKNGALSNYIAMSDDGLVWKCPESWTLAEAATVPIAYTIVYLALIVRANIKKDNTILIHSATGGVGLAAVRVCLAYGLTVFTTVSTPEKRKYLLNNFPQLKPNHIGCSRDISFEKMIKHETNGIGVNFVLNSLSGDKLAASIRCLADKGKLMEIGKHDLIKDSKIGLREFLREITYHSIFLENVMKSNRSEIESVKKLIEQDISAGIIQPLPTTIYPANDLPAAFEYLNSGKHIGKVIVKIRENANDSGTLQIPVVRRFLCDPKSSYIIIGGLGGFGLELADWLIKRGARQLVLSSRKGISTPYQQHRINIWKSYGIRITIATYNITTRSGCAEIFKDAHQLGPVSAIFNLAALLEENLLNNQDAEKFNTTFGPKSYATEHFDQLSRALCPRLQHFVVFTCMSSGRGNLHQTSYGMTNSVMERIMEQRHNDNLPGVAIQWGAIGDVGMVADLQPDKINIELNGIVTQRISSCLEQLDQFLTNNTPVVSSMVVAENVGGEDHSHSTLFKDLGDIFTAEEMILELTSQKTTNSNSAVIMVPGIESVLSSQLRNIAASLKHPVYCLQLWNIKSVDEISTTIAEVARNLVLKLEKNIEQVNIVGYSFGSIASLHLAAEFEKLNIKTNVILIDGSPEFTKELISATDDELIETSILEAIYNQLFDDIEVDFILNLLPGSPFSDRLDNLLELLNSKSHTEYPMSYLKQFAENGYWRLMSLADFNLGSVPTIRSKISLARAQNALNIDELYGLKSYSMESIVDVRRFEGDHDTILEQAELIEWLQECLI